MSQFLTLKPRSVESIGGSAEWVPLRGMPAAAYAVLVIHDTVSSGTLQGRIRTRFGVMEFDFVAFSSQGSGGPRTRVVKMANRVDESQLFIPAGSADRNFIGPEVLARWNLSGGDFDFSILLQTETR